MCARESWPKQRFLSQISPSLARFSEMSKWLIAEVESDLGVGGTVGSEFNVGEGNRK